MTDMTELIRSGEAGRITAEESVVTIGVFDGVHTGHQKVISEALDRARDTGTGRTVLVTFDRHPLSVTRPELAPGLLTTLDEKLSLLMELGLDIIFVERFDESTAAIPYGDYIKERLIGALGMKELVVGYDFHLGRGREGGSGALAEEGGRSGFGVTIVPPVVVGGTAVSSTRIRKNVSERKMGRAARFLTRPYFFDADVERGGGVGHILGYPTANACVAHPEKLIPPGGAYAVTVETGGEVRGGMMNIGLAPTVRCDGRESIEVHIFDFDGDLYGSRLRINVIEYIRDERRFKGRDELMEQLLKDSVTARGILEKKR
jgi:riboflavin kinase/FMN adenylyltransferase